MQKISGFHCNRLVCSNKPRFTHISDTEMQKRASWHFVTNYSKVPKNAEKEATPEIEMMRLEIEKQKE